jgi:hypothetical protein
MTEFQLTRFMNLRRQRKQRPRDRARVIQRFLEDEARIVKLMRRDGLSEDEIARDVAASRRAQGI